jgi:Fe-S-cluster containining protein
MSGDSEAVHWWDEGVCFSCLSCGRCCGESPGTVSFTEAEESAMSSALGISVFEFRALYVWRRYGAPSLRERENYDCVFLERVPLLRCGIYDVRPLQCRTFPFWPEVMRSRSSWGRFADSCPGMNQGAFHDSRDIASLLSLSLE